MEMIEQFFTDESGATVAEYAILAALIAVTVVVIIGLIGVVLEEKFTGFCTAIKGDAC